MPIKNFSPHVAGQIGYYVYRLIDPRNGETFYVGKGKGDRVFHHAAGNFTQAQMEDESDDEVSAKIERIRTINHVMNPTDGDRGSGVIHVIHRHGMDEATALEVEAALIDAYPGLTNDQGGHHSSERGSMHADELQAKYGLPEMPDCQDLKLLLININAIESNAGWDNVYDQVRSSWRLSPVRARQADYVVAVWRGITKGVYIADRWLQRSDSTRFEFEGRKAPPDIWDRIVGLRGKRVTHPDMRHVQNPIRYWNIG